MEQEVWRGETCLAKCRVTLACIGPDGRPARIPAERDARRWMPATAAADRNVTGLDSPGGFSEKSAAKMWYGPPREPDQPAAEADPRASTKQAHMQPDTLAAAQQIDFSLLALFFRATFTVKIVMLVLVAASFWSWAIIIQKLLDLRRVRDEARAFDQEFWSGESLDTVYDRIGPEPAGAAARVFAAGMTELRRSSRQDGGLIAGTQSRIERAMDVAIGREAEKLNKGLSFLATVGSIAPFVGLFGTVWGIKHAFEEIALQQSTNLAVVAPGIAEALLATGLGLLAAIPAVIFYNKLTQETERVIGGYEGFADEFSMILSRQLDRAA